MDVFLAQRRKALVALVVSLVGGVLAVFPDHAGLQVVAAVVSAVATAFGVHQIPNAPAGPTVGEQGPELINIPIVDDLL